ncbi:podocin-like [Periophthalmus magnuspinnatus]|uniref:podocin-like n=1 Tax=Periophthalmus magnuspinnatus TaxID=409849 RepID=UPI002437242A|nr:podocin-like [Periophthalmus magnuspinnatus]
MDSTTSGPKPRKERSHRAQNSTSKSARVQKRREGARGREEEEKREEKEEVKRATVVDMDSVRREEEQENAGDLEITTGQDDGLKRRSLGALEWALMVFVLSLVLLFLPVSIWFCVRVVREHERAVVFRLGHLLRGKPRGPGGRVQRRVTLSCDF